MTTNTIAVVTADRNGTIIGWAGQATEWFGHAASTILGRSVDDLVPDEFREDHRNGLRRAMSGGERHLEGAATHLPVLHVNGDISVHPARFNHLFDASGDLVAAAAVFGPASTTAAAWQPVHGSD